MCIQDSFRIIQLIANLPGTTTLDNPQWVVTPKFYAQIRVIYFHSSLKKIGHQNTSVDHRNRSFGVSPFPPAQFDANSTKASVQANTRYIQISQRTCWVFRRFPRFFLVFKQILASPIFLKKRKPTAKGHPSLSSLLLVLPYSPKLAPRRRSFGAQQFHWYPPSSCDPRRAASCKNAIAYPSHEKKNHHHLAAGVVIFVVIFCSLPSNWTLLRTENQNQKRNNSFKINMFEHLWHFNLSLFCVFVTCSSVCFAIFQLRVQETTDHWNSLPGATRMGHLRSKRNRSAGFRVSPLFY